MIMKVKELIKQLKTLPEDTEVWLSSDEEGNDFNPLLDLGFCLAWRHSKWEFDLIDPDEKDEYPQDQIQELLVLWP